MIDMTENFDVIFTEDESFEIEFSYADTTSKDDYQGTYEVSPSEDAQTLETANKTLTQNVIINPIPSNYGLITWDGSVLTVS